MAAWRTRRACADAQTSGALIFGAAWTDALCENLFG
jgi:hypothetical protein